MNIDKLKDIFNKDLDCYKSFLIDGSWGIGKSSFINTFLSKKSYIYLSLFGIKDSKELENNLFLELKNSSDKLNKLCQFYEPYNIKTNSFKNDFNNTFKDTLYVVLDDLEKKNDTITYKELFGLINALKGLNSVKIIVLCDSTKIGSYIDIFNSLSTLVIIITLLILVEIVLMILLKVIRRDLIKILLVLRNLIIIYILLLISIRLRI